MTGMTNYTAFNFTNYITGQIPMPSLPSVFLALFTAAGTDAGTGFTEVTGGAYTRIQVAGALTASGTWTTASTTITLSATAPAWLTALGTNGSGVSVYDTTNSQFIGTVSSVSGTTVTLTAAAAHASSGAADALTFSAFPPAAGTAPTTDANGAQINFPTATANWGTVIAFGFYDAATSGNLQIWDFMGNFSWLPFEVASGSNPSFSVKGNGYLSNDPIVFTAEYGGTLPSASTGTFTGYTVNFVASPTTDAISVDTTSGPSTPVVLTSSGSGMVRKITQQIIPNGVTAFFSPSQFTITAA